MMSKKDTKFGNELLEALEEVRAHRRGEIALPSRVVERRFGIPARTVEGWEQGRKLDVAASILMTMIENAPEVVEATLAKNRAA
jgi:putative transcriptional regulator